VHVVLELDRNLLGFVVVCGCLRETLDGWTALFLVSTAATSVTGFLFHIPSLFCRRMAWAFLSLLVLAIAILARYPLHLAGGWRRITRSLP